MVFSAVTGAYPEFGPEQALDMTRWRRVARRAQSLAEALGLSGRVEVKGLEAKGSLFLASASSIPGKVKVFINPKEFEKLSSSEQDFALAHELAHLVRNEGLRHLFFHVGAYIAQGATMAAFCSPAIPILPYLGLQGVNYVVHNIAGALFARGLEAAADQKAYTILSKRGLQGARKFFRRVLILEQQCQQPNPMKRTLWNIVDFVQGQFNHPATKDRLHSVEEWIDKTRGSRRK